MKIPIKTKRIELEDDYKGGWIEVRTNPPAGVLLDCVDAIQAANQEKLGEMLPPIYRTLELMVLKWNFTDQKKKDLPCNVESLKILPIDLLVLLTTKVQEVAIGLPLANNTR